MNDTSISFDELYMKMVYLVASKSKDPSTKIGAVIVKDNRVISTGYNGFPIGVDDEISRYNDRETKYMYIVHAEHNAILASAKFGISTMGTTLYTNGLPCNSCMKAVIQSGISEIVIHDKWPSMNHSDWERASEISRIMLYETKLKLRVFRNTLGVKAFINHKEIDV